VRFIYVATSCITQLVEDFTEFLVLVLTIFKKGANLTFN